MVAKEHCSEAESRCHRRLEETMTAKVLAELIVNKVYEKEIGVRLCREETSIKLSRTFLMFCSLPSLTSREGDSVQATSHGIERGFTSPPSSRIPVPWGVNPLGKLQAGFSRIPLKPPPGLLIKDTRHAGPEHYS